MDIDILARVAESEKWDAAELRELIFRLKKQKDTLLTDHTIRESRYSSASTVFNIARSKS